LDGLLDVLLIVFVPIGLIISAMNYVDEVKKGKELNLTVEALRGYSDVARLNVLGKTGIAGFGLIETTPISKLLEGAFVVTEGKADPKCDSESLNKFRTVVERFPTFPFSYYSLAVCLRKYGNDDSWRYYAHRAIEILKKTTMLAGHDRGHDEALKELQDDMKQ
jgi:hypothetical protein